MKSLAAALTLVALSATQALAATPPYVTAALAAPGRPKADLDADALRDPDDTLAFVGVKPGMTVAELFPGGGYFTRPLSAIVGPKGHIIGIENAGWKGAVKADQAMIAEPGHTNVSLDVEPFGQMTLPGKVDVFWITQNYHDLKIAKFGIVDMAAFNAHVFQALKPGGVYFILDHEANPGTTLDEIATLHRVEKTVVIREVTAAGFVLVGEGKFLNRAGDDHSKPIFDPAIQGKTDQYALKFIKPRT
ncbi:class I SAM-dependent methyltransferase [Phenylobacterium sp.]|uniref:class I SAM-dependent methyltransferase n=1 Tax=Phenylobacterium sp. TaxID=1871053 RepID=UPI00356586AB